jgi:hypothetical protein
LAKGEQITQDISTLENPAILGQLGQAYWLKQLKVLEKAHSEKSGPFLIELSMLNSTRII